MGIVGTPYWMAPELLRGDSHNTAKSDVYSFGIMLYEIYSRNDPYFGEDYKHVLRLVRDPVACKRPPIPPHCPEAIAMTMIDCLDNDPSRRPTFESLDLRMKRLELKDVELRNVGKQQTKEDDMYKRFPSHVADALRDGRRVEPESREMVSVGFCGFVRLEDIRNELPATKIVSLMQRTYERLDQLAKVYDIFTVHTNGDSYMVVSNLAKDQSDHAKRIMEFSSAAINVSRDIPIDESNPERGHLMMSIGFHSGPVVANIVGSRNASYCLFGETVNSVFKLQTESLENRIHCSQASATLVYNQYPEATIQCRGFMNVKGGGKVCTYWAQSPDGSVSGTENTTNPSLGSSEQDSTFNESNPDGNGFYVGPPADLPDALALPHGLRSFPTNLGE